MSDGHIKLREQPTSLQPSTDIMSTCYATAAQMLARSTHPQLTYQSLLVATSDTLSECSSQVAGLFDTRDYRLCNLMNIYECIQCCANEKNRTNVCTVSITIEYARASVFNMRAHQYFLDDGCDYGTFHIIQHLIEFPIFRN